MTAPSADVRFDIAFTTAPDAATPAWEDVTSRAQMMAGYTITRGRTDQYSTVQPSTMSVTLDNPTGEFTAGYTGSSHYPNVLLDRRIRCSVRRRDAAGVQIPGNFISAESASFEGGTVGGWVPGGSVPPTLSNSALHPDNGTKGMLITWGTGGAFPQAQLSVSGLVIGRQYTMQARVFVPAGTAPFVALVIPTIGGGTANNTRGTMQTISVTWTHTAAAGGPTVVVQIQPSSAPTSGDQCFVDSILIDEGAAVQTFTTSAPPISYRFDGCVNAWPTTFDQVGMWSDAQITATDRTSRLANSAKLLSVIGNEYRLDSPVAYYPLSDAEGATAAGNKAKTPQPNLAVTQIGSGGTLTFGSATGPADGLTAPSFAPSSVTNGLYLKSPRLFTKAGGFGLTLECTALTSAAVAQKILRGIDGYGNFNEITFTAGGNVQAVLWNVNTQTATYTLTSGSAFNDGHTHHVALTESASGGTVTVNLWVDGTSVANTTYSAPFTLGIIYLEAGGTGTGALLTGTLSHIAAYTSALSSGRISAHSTAVSTGFSGERSDQRIARLASYAGFAAGDVTVETGASTSIAAQAMNDSAVIDLMRAVETTESGMLFVSGAGKLVFQARSHRYNQASTLTFTTETYDADIAFTYDRFGIANEVTATRPNGPTVVVDNLASQSSTAPGVGGVYTRDLGTLLTTSDNEVLDAANWTANTNGFPMPRCPQLPVDLMTQQALLATVLAVELGDRVTVANLPSMAPASSVDLSIEGWTETYAGESWDIVFATSSASTDSVWKLDDTTYSVLDSTTRLAY